MLNGCGFLFCVFFMDFQGNRHDHCPLFSFPIITLPALIQFLIILNKYLKIRTHIEHILNK